MVQTIRNMYSGSANTAPTTNSRGGGGPSREGDRPEWASAMNNKDYYRTSQSTFTCSQTIREQKESLPIYRLKEHL